jgi:hypothetical protein
VNCVSHTIVEKLKQFAFQEDKSRVVRRTFWLIKVVPTWKKFQKRCPRRHITMQYFILLLGHCEISVERYRCVMCGHCFSPVFNKEKDRRYFKEWCEQRQKYIHANLVTGLQMGQPDDYSFVLCDSTIHYWWHTQDSRPLELLKKYTPESFGVYTLHYVIWPLELVFKTWHL